MDKAEKELIREFVDKHGHNSYDLKKDVKKLITEISREVAVEFAKNLLQYLPGDIAPFEEGNCELFFDEWKSNQEENNE